MNNAGMGCQGKSALQRLFCELEEADGDNGLAVTLKTAFLASRAYLPDMQAAGYRRVVNVASVTGPYVTNPGESAYSAAKAGMVGMTRALALQCGPYGVTSNAAAPGWIDTGASTEEERRAALATPLGRAGRTGEVAAALAFLARSCGIALANVLRCQRRALHPWRSGEFEFGRFPGDGLRVGREAPGACRGR